MKLAFTIAALIAQGLLTPSFAVDPDFFAHPILQAYLPKNEPNLTLVPAQQMPGAVRKFDADSIAKRIEGIWNQDGNRVQQNGNAGWETDFVTTARDKNLNRMIYENNLSPVQYQEAITAWERNHNRAVIKGPQTLPEAGEKIFDAGRLGAGN